MELKDIRNTIDQIDDQMLELFVRRMETAREVAAYKKEHGLPILDSGREREVLNRVSEKAGPGLERYTKLLYQTMFDLSRGYQSSLLSAGSPLMKRLDEAVANKKEKLPNRALVACQGTEGAYAQKACDHMFEFANILYMNTFDDVFAAVEKGMCPYGVLPIENSSAGSVTQVYDLMEKHNFSIVRAVRERIEHKLMALPGTRLEDVREVVSHEQALRQCSAFFHENPKISATQMGNTAKAAEFVAASGRDDLAVIASGDCRELYGLSVLQESVSNAESNFTRFICIAKDMQLYDGANKISLMLRAPHRPGSLYRLLSQISVMGINLTKLESRPMPGRDFEFRFFFDLEASIAQADVRALICELERLSEQFTFLGNYEEMH